MFTLRKKKKKVRYTIDEFAPDRIRGWAWRVGDDEHVCRVEFKSGEKVLAGVDAGTIREDLLAAGIGNGCHSFDFDPGLSMFAEYPLGVDVYIDGRKMTREPLSMRPDHDRVFDAYGKAMEKRMDALLALHAQQAAGEMEQLRNEIRELRRSLEEGKGLR